MPLIIETKTENYNLEIGFVVQILTVLEFEFEFYLFYRIDLKCINFFFF